MIFKNNNILKKLLLMVVLMFVCLVNVSAEEIDGSVTITGRNTYGKMLSLEIECTNVDTNLCKLEDIHWYSNDKNSTEGGTEITDAVGKEKYVIDESLVGKYIYAVATIKSITGDYESKAVSDITDSENNVTATVGRYIEYIDNSKYSIDADYAVRAGSSLNVTLNGLEENKDSVYIYFSNGEVPTVEETSSGCSMVDTSTWRYVDNSNGKITDTRGLFLQDGYNQVYIFIDTKDQGHCKVTKEPITMKMPELQPLDKRYQYYFFSDSSHFSLFPLYPFYPESGSYSFITKVGIINDNNLLKKLAQNTNDSLTSLLDYAKNNDGITYENVYDTGNTDWDDGDLDSLKIIDGMYYFLYTTTNLKTSEGYRNIEGVSVAMAKLGYLSNDVEYDINDGNNNNTDTSTDKKVTENPKTGDVLIFVAWVIAMGAFSYSVYYFKNRKQENM